MSRISVDAYVEAENPLENLVGKEIHLNVSEWRSTLSNWAPHKRAVVIEAWLESNLSFGLYHIRFRTEGPIERTATFYGPSQETKNMFLNVKGYKYKELK